jgi:hypothetical protein
MGRGALAGAALDGRTRSLAANAALAALGAAATVWVIASVHGPADGPVRDAILRGVVD